MNLSRPLRTVRSFVRREGRMTPAQRRAWMCHWERYGVALQAGETLDLDRLFGRRAPRILEIGCGMGDALLAMAGAAPQQDYLGIEVYRTGLGSLMQRLVEAERENVRLINADALEVLPLLPAAGFDAILLFFPDPWPKKRHHKRRIVQPVFIRLLASRLKPGGMLHMVTDWEDYAGHMLQVMAQCPEFTNTAGKDSFAPRPDYRPLTRFEQRAHGLGHEIRELVFIRVGAPVATIPGCR